jgi:hypothetical protein
MYENSNNVRTEEKMDNAQHLKDLFEEKNKLDKKYTKFIRRYQIVDRCFSEASVGEKHGQVGTEPWGECFG